MNLYKKLSFAGACLAIAASMIACQSELKPKGVKKQEQVVQVKQQDDTVEPIAVTDTDTEVPALIALPPAQMTIVPDVSLPVVGAISGLGLTYNTYDDLFDYLKDHPEMLTDMTSLNFFPESFDILSGGQPGAYLGSQFKVLTYGKVLSDAKLNSEILSVGKKEIQASYEFKIFSGDMEMVVSSATRKAYFQFGDVNYDTDLGTVENNELISIEFITEDRISNFDVRIVGVYNRSLPNTNFGGVVQIRLPIGYSSLCYDEAPTGVINQIEEAPDAPLLLPEDFDARGGCWQTLGAFYEAHICKAIPDICEWEKNRGNSVFLNNF